MRRSVLGIGVSAVVLLGGLVSGVAVSAASKIETVSFTGSAASPTVTVTGSFGTKPKSKKDPCVGAPGYETGKAGFDYGKQFASNSLWFMDTSLPGQEWLAGASATESGGPYHGASCIGIVVEDWTASTIVFHFGSVYHNPFYELEPGNHFVLHAPGTYYGGIVSYPG